jgi:antitoxin MazE
VKSRISRWGNSLALRLPKEAIELANLHAGDEVTIVEDAGTLIIDPRTRVNLEALIAQMSPETFHDDPFAAAPVVGAEIW